MDHLEYMSRLQLPEEQSSYFAQALQDAPARPQAEVELPVLHVVPWQQPVQLPGPQVGVGTTQAPFWHCSPDWQALHCWPFLPQKPKVVPGLQVPPEQQPEQFAGVQVGGGVPQVPLLHCWPPGHCLHLLPP